MHSTKNLEKKVHLFIVALLILFLLCTLFSQNASCKEIKTDATIYKIAIIKFEQTAGDQPLKTLETVIPHLLRASLLRYSNIEVIPSSEMIEKTDKFRMTTQTSSQTISLKKQNIRFTLRGTITKIEDNIRVDVFMIDLTNNSIILGDFIIFQNDTIMSSIDQLGKRLGSKLLSIIAPAETEKKILFAIVRPFDNRTVDKKYDSLESVLPPSVLAYLLKANLKKVLFKDVAPDEAGQKDIDALITGEYVVNKDSIDISAHIKERSGLTLRFKVTDSIERIPDITKILSNRLSEIINGRITEDGKWRQEPILFTESGSNEFLTQGMKYVSTQNYYPAILMFRKAIEKSPNHLDARFRLADVYTTLKNYEMVIAEYYDIINLDRSNANAHCGLGRAYCEMGKYDDAVPEFKMALDLATNNPVRFDAHNGLGDVCLLQGKYEDAIGYYLNAMEINDKNPEIYLSLGRAYVATKSFDKAILYFEDGWKLLRLNPRLKMNLLQFITIEAKSSTVRRIMKRL